MWLKCQTLYENRVWRFNVTMHQLLTLWKMSRRSKTFATQTGLQALSAQTRLTSVYQGCWKRDISLSFLFRVRIVKLSSPLTHTHTLGLAECSSVPLQQPALLTQTFPLPLWNRSGRDDRVSPARTECHHKVKRLSYTAAGRSPL